MKTGFAVAAGFSAALLAFLLGHVAHLRSTRKQRWKQARRRAKGRELRALSSAAPQRRGAWPEHRFGEIPADFTAADGERDRLRRQLDPHFLFNALASISGNARESPEIAEEMIARLAEFYRLSLRPTAQGAWHSLGEELALLHSFFAIELMRLGDLLTVDIVCPATLTVKLLPPLLLLPLVENALKYGRASSAERVGVRIVIWEARDTLHIEIANTGRWLEPAAHRHVPSLGVGLANVRARLAGYFPERHALEHRQNDGWVTVALRIVSAEARVRAA